MPPPSESLSPRGQLDHFRSIRSKASQAECIRWLTKQVLTEAGFVITVDSPGEILCATHPQKRLEIRISYRNQTLGGDQTTGHDRKPRGWIGDALEKAHARFFDDGYQERPMVRITTTAPLHWSDLAALI